MLAALLLFAQKEADKPAGSPPGSGLEIPLMLLVGMALFWLVVLRPQRQHKDSQRRSLLDETKKNDQVLINDFVYGQVVSISDKQDEVVVRLDENVRVRFVKAAITRNFTYEERIEAQRDAAKAKTDQTTTDSTKDKVAPK